MVGGKLDKNFPSSPKRGLPCAPLCARKSAATPAARFSSCGSRARCPANSYSAHAPCARPRRPPAGPFPIHSPRLRKPPRNWQGSSILEVMRRLPSRILRVPPFRAFFAFGHGFGPRTLGRLFRPARIGIDIQRSGALKCNHTPATQPRPSLPDANLPLPLYTRPSLPLQWCRESTDRW